MIKPRTVAVYGNSLFIAGIQASLKIQPELQVSEIGGSDPDLTAPLAASCPDVIIFDLTSTRPLISLAFLAEHPQVLFIGLDLNSDRVLVLSGQFSKVVTTDHLLQLILQEPAGEELPARPPPEQIENLTHLEPETRETTNDREHI